jgi:hypothetical protein
MNKYILATAGKRKKDAGIFSFDNFSKLNEMLWSRIDGGTITHGAITKIGLRLVNRGGVSFEKAFSKSIKFEVSKKTNDSKTQKAP